MKNQKQVNRMPHNTENPYVCISSLLYGDKRINMIELGIMTKLLSDSDNYIFNSTFFLTESGLTETQYYNSIKNLIKFGYINKKRIKGGVLWVINESSNEHMSTPIIRTGTCSSSTCSTSTSLPNTNIPNTNQPSLVPDGEVVENPQRIFQTTNPNIELEPSANILEPREKNKKLDSQLEEPLLSTIIEEIEYSSDVLCVDSPDGTSTQKQEVKEEATQIEATQIEATQIEATQIEATQIEVTQIEATQIEATQIEVSQLSIAKVKEQLNNYLNIIPNWEQLLAEVKVVDFIYKVLPPTKITRNMDDQELDFFQDLLFRYGSLQQRKITEYNNSIFEYKDNESKLISIGSSTNI